METDIPVENIIYTLPQVLAALCQKKETYIEWGRGGGKSTIIGKRLKDAAHMLPRGKFGIVGETYQQLLTRTLPSTIEGLEMHGLKKDLHFFVGTKPPKSWKWLEAYQPPLHYENYMWFYTGFGAQLISLDNPNAGRGINIDGGIGDEAAMLNPEKLGNNFLTANRGNIHRFNSWLHHSLLFATSTPITLLGRWFLKQEELARENPKDMFYLKASSRYNAANLGPDFFKQNKRLLTKLQYDAEIDCIRPGKVTNGFYPLFDELEQCYTASNDSYLFSLNFDFEKLKNQTCEFDSDLKKNAPLDVAFDYGAKINTAVIGQEQSYSFEFKILNAMFVKTPSTVMDLAQKICDYYSTHVCKVINYYYDHTAEYKSASTTTTFADEVTKVFETNGWQVNRIYVGQAPGHNTKHLFFNLVMGRSESNLPHVSLNKNNCKNLIVSIQQAGAIDGKKGIEKDKRPERNPNAVDEETTHFSDAFDTLVYWKYKDRMISAGWYG